MLGTGRLEKRKAHRSSNLFVIAAAWIFLTTIQSYALGQQPRVLILSAFDHTLRAATQTIGGITARLGERGGRRFAIDAEFLDLVRVPDPEHESRTASLLREKYAAKPPEVVVVVGRGALEFVIKHPDLTAPNIPVVFAEVAPETYAALKPPSNFNFTGILFDLNLNETLDLAERLQPSAKRLFIINGGAPEGHRWDEAVRRAIEQRRRQPETTYLYGATVDSLMSEVSRIPRDSIVILLSFLIDGDGKSVVPRELAEQVARASPAPVYSPYSSYLGTGVVGGYGQTFESHGAAAADLVLAIDAGQDPATLPPKINPTQAYRVDATAMARWNLDQRSLPPDSIVLFSGPSLWQEHRYLILAVILLIALQTAIVVALLVHRRRRQQAENSLRESEDRLTFTAAAANIGLWRFDRSTGALWATDHCRTMFGLATDAPMTRETFLAAVHPQDRDVAVQTLRGITKGGAATTDFRVVRPDGEIRWFSIRARAPLDDAKVETRLSGVLVDITDQKTAEAETELQRQEVTHLMRVSLLGELSGAIAHEINQPLTAILTNAQAALYLLDGESSDLTEVRGALNDIVSEDKRAGNVVQKLRRLLKKGETRYELVQVNEIVDSTAILLHSEFIKRHVKVEADLAASRPAVLGDSVQLQQVLLNLVMNAMDAMVTTPERQRCVSISTRDTTAGDVEILVKDRGTGIGPAERKKLFMPFHTTKEQGLGIGLTICSAIVRKHGGTIQLYNEAAGGAVAKVTLPAHLVTLAAQ